MSFRKVGAEFLVNTSTTLDQSESGAITLSDGRTVVVWKDASASGADASGTAIRGQIFNGDGSRSGAEFLVNQTTAGDQGYPTVNALPTGGFVVSYSTNPTFGTDSTGDATVARIFDANGAGGPEIQVNTTTTGPQDDPTIGVFADGGFSIAFEDETSIGQDDIRLQMFKADGTANGAESLVNTITSSTQVNAKITVLKDGNFVVTWLDSSQVANLALGNEVRAQMYGPTGSPIGGEFLVNTTTQRSQEDPDIAALDSGGFVITWSDNSNDVEPNPKSKGIVGQLFDAGGNKVFGEFLVNTTIINDQINTRVVSTGDGRFIAVWTDRSESADDPSGRAVRARVFTDDGRACGSDFLVNAAIAGDQFNPSVAARGDGTILITFTDGSLSADDASGNAIRGQIFNLLEQSGTAGDDLLIGGTLGDQLDGGDGNDRLEAGKGKNKVDGGAGTDTAYIAAKFSDVVLSGYKGILKIKGADFNTSMTRVEFVKFLGSDQEFALKDLFPKAIIGTNRADAKLKGTSSGELIDGKKGDDSIKGRGGDDYILGRSGADKIKAGSGDDEINGGAGKDRIYGGSGDDLIIGGKGIDTLTGGSGFDTFIFSSKIKASNIDVITDFSAARDTIWLNDSIFKAINPGMLAADAFHIGKKAADAEDRIVYNSKNGDLFYDADGTGSAKAKHFATLDKGLALTEADFFVY